MSRKIRLLTLVLIMLLLLMTMTSCGRKTLEETIGSDTSVFDDIVKDVEMEGTASIYVKGNILVFDYDLKGSEGMTEEKANSVEMLKELEASLDANESTYLSLCEQLQNSLNNDKIKISINYKYGETILAHRLFEL